MSSSALLELPTTASLDNNPHYLRAITQMAAQQRVVCAQDLYDRAGVKVLNAGDVLKPEHFDLLRTHHLGAPIDDSLRLADPVDLPSIETEVMMQTASQPLGRELAASVGGRTRLLEPLRHMRWPHQAQVKLAVMRANNPTLYEHSVLMMMVCLQLALKDGMNPQQCANAAAAGLWHDVGMLYLPPEWSDTRHHFGPEERRGLATHPAIASVLIHQTGAYDTSVSTAVLQHHERLDGSGYPMQLSAAAITPLGGVLLVAEVVSAFYAKYGDVAAQRLSLTLRLNHTRFPPKLSNHVLAMLPEEHQSSDTPAPPLHSMLDVKTAIATVSRIYRHWHSAHQAAPEGWEKTPHAGIFEFVDSKLATLEKGLIEAGLHPRQQADWSGIFQEDPYGMTDLVFIVREAVWQIETLIHSCIRRWPQLLSPPADDALLRAVGQWIRSCLSVIAESKSA